MPKFTVRMDVCLTYEIEADDEDTAQEEAESRYDSDDFGDDQRVVETLVFGEDE